MTGFFSDGSEFQGFRSLRVLFELYNYAVTELVVVLGWRSG
jgi:hypothetical protein